ncbi:dihydrodipicolinate synthase family protein [Micromonospora sp. NPDC048830]|uniref:dihydrodipicolinate synthase family protein n=1 Tax=Micromonospora sp. NPDC048830 TaxID=3364257 RepID=UPI003715CF43
MVRLVDEIFQVTGLPMVIDHGPDPAALAASMAAAGLPPVVGVKFSSWNDADWDRLLPVIRGQGHMISGKGDAVAHRYFARGATSFTSSVVNLAPLVVKELERLLTSGDLGQAERLTRDLLLPFEQARAASAQPPVAVLKGALAVADLVGGPCRNDGQRNLGEEERDRLVSVVRTLRGHRVTSSERSVTGRHVDAGCSTNRSSPP